MKRKLLILLAACLILTFVPATFVGTAALEADRDFACACSMQSNSGDYKNIVYYGATSVVRMSAEQATQNNVPAGYSGDVIYVENQTKDALGTGIMLDFSSLNIKIEDLRSITFRVYVETDGTTNDGYPEFRIIKPNPKSSETPSGWVMRYDASQQTDQWIEITLGADGLNFLSGASFASLALDGYLNKFELGVRAHAKVLDFYIDSISYKVYSLDDGEEFACEYSASTDANYLKYGSTSVKQLSATEAAAVNIPQGYTNNVLVVENSSPSMGVLLDFSKFEIPYGLVESMTFRVFVGDDGLTGGDKQEVRIVQPGNEAWIMRYSVENKTERWIDITLNRDGTNFESTKSFKHLSANGVLNKFELSVRSYQDVIPFYIDSIQISLKEDTNAPEIRYNGGDSLVFFEGENTVLDISAYDAEMECEVDLVWNWSDPDAMGEDGKLKRGEYTLTIEATDYHGNTASRTFTVSAVGPDTEPPVIQSGPTVMYLLTGTIPRLDNPLVTDNSGRFEYTAFWSEDALDDRGRLNEGLYLYTMKATDYSGNKTVKKIIVYVVDELPEDGYIIDEENSVIIGGNTDNEDENQTPPTDPNPDGGGNTGTPGGEAPNNPAVGSGDASTPNGETSSTPVDVDKGAKSCSSTVSVKELMLLLAIPVAFYVFRRRERAT